MARPRYRVTVEKSKHHFDVQYSVWWKAANGMPIVIAYTDTKTRADFVKRGMSAWSKSRDFQKWLRENP
jgi:hypothetical protein